MARQITGKAGKPQRLFPFYEKIKRPSPPRKIYHEAPYDPHEVVAERLQKLRKSQLQKELNFGPAILEQIGQIPKKIKPVPQWQIRTRESAGRATYKNGKYIPNPPKFETPNYVKFMVGENHCFFLPNKTPKKYIKGLVRVFIEINKLISKGKIWVGSEASDVVPTRLWAISSRGISVPERDYPDLQLTREEKSVFEFANAFLGRSMPELPLRYAKPRGAK